MQRDVVRTPAPDRPVTPAARLAERIDVERQRARLAALIHQLAAPDRQLVLLYLEGLDAAAIGDVMGLSPANVATRVHRVKRVLARRVLAERAPPGAGGTTGAPPTTHPEVTDGR